MEGRLQKSIQSGAVTVKSLCTSPNVINRFSDILGDQNKANQFLASLTTAVQGNPALMKCNPMSTIRCAMIAASLNLDINPNLGFAAIVPYGNEPQFQMMVRGYVQLAQRSNQYKNINVTEIYEDEFVSYSPLEGYLKCNWPTGGQRDQGLTDKIVGYACFFEMINGFQKTVYWTVEQVKNHGKRYSKSFGNANGLWKTNFDAMAKKTVLKNALSKWGILSTQMIAANLADQSTGGNYEVDANGITGDFEYADSGEAEPQPAEEPATQPETNEEEAF